MLFCWSGPLFRETGANHSARNLRVIDDDRVGIRNIEPAFHDVRANQHIMTLFDEVNHLLFELLAFELSVRDGNIHFGSNAMNHRGHFLDVANPIMNEENLSAATDFKFHFFFDLFRIENHHLGFNRLAVRRRGIDNGKIARSQQRELQCPRNGGGCECKRVDMCPKLSQFFFG